MAKELIVRVIGDTRGLEKSYRKAAADTDKLSRSLGQSGRGAIAVSGIFSGLGRQVAFASGAFLGGAGLVAGLKSSVTAATNLAEQTNKVNVIFGRSARTITDWAKTTATSIGIANDQALEAAGTFGNLFTTVGLAPQQNAELSRSLVTLAADLASFNDATPEDTLAALQSGLIGEAEPLRRFGVLLSETRVQQEAMRETGKKNVRQLTDQEKLLARYNLILKDTLTAQGDFARTADGQANSQRTLTAELRDTQAMIGKALLPTVQKVTTALKDWLKEPENQKKLQDTTEKTTGFLGKLAHEFKAGVDAANDFGKASRALNDRIESNVRGFFSLGDAARKTGEDIRLAAAAAGAFNVTAPTGEDVQFRGAGARGTTFVTPMAGMGTRKWRASLNYQISLANEAMAKAELTAGQKDDRARLVRLAALTSEKIAKTKDLGDRTRLYGSLKSINDQIASIDEQRNQKESDAREKQLAAEKRRQERFAEQVRKANEQVREYARRARAQAEQQKRAMQDATGAALEMIGSLFQGPVLSNNTAGILGVRSARPLGGRPGIGALTADVKAQTAAAARFNNDLTRLARRGAPPGLIQTLVGQGQAGAGFAHTLATAGRGSLNTFLRAYGQRQTVAQQIARADIQARHVTIVTGQVGHRATNSSQRRGPSGGIPNTRGQHLGF